MNTIFALSLTGSCMAAGYYVLSFLLGDAFSHRLRYLWLKLTLVGFLLPLPWLGRDYTFFLQNTFDIQRIELPVYYDYRDVKKIFTDEVGNFYISAGLYREILFAVLSFCIAFIILLVMLGKMRKNYRLLAKNSELRLFKKVKIHLVEQDCCGSGGIFAPFVIMRKGMDEAEEAFILKHELMHIKRRDTLFKALLWLAVGIHWFNPFVHLLRKQLERECELSCDDRVLAHCSQDERAEYAKFLVMHALKKGNPLMVAWKNDEVPIKERVNNIMSDKEKSRGKSIVCIVLMAVMLFGSSFTVLAYDIVSTESNEAYNPASKSGFVRYGEFSFYEECDDEWKSDYIVDTVLYDNQFTDEDGNIYEITEEMQAYANCGHPYVSGKAAQHVLHADGSCNLITHYAQLCKKCGGVILGELRSDSYSFMCPH